MASTSRLGDVSVRPDAPSSRRSISSQAASASRALTSAASASISSPYAGLSSSPSSSSSLSTPKRHSIASASRTSLSRYNIPSPSNAAEPATATSIGTCPQLWSPPSGSISSASDAHYTEPAKYPTSATASSSRAANEAPRMTDSAIPLRRTPPSRPPAAQRSPRTHRRRSADSLRLDLDGLDLGGTPAFGPLDSDDGLSHVRTRSNTTQPSSAGAKPPVRNYNRVHVAPDQFCDTCAPGTQSHHVVNGIEDSFSLHLREECSDYREIMSSQAVLNAAIHKDARMQNTTHLDDGDDSVDKHRPRGLSITHGQVLGGFASLGLQTESSPVPPMPPVRQHPVSTATNGSTDSSKAPATPIEWRDSFGAGPFDAPTAQNTLSPKWAYLGARPCNPLEPLDVLSIEEMGLHSLDVGSLNDWEGCKLSAEILCPVNGHQRIEWSVAQTTRRNKKWVVVPNATVTCGVSERLSPAEQAERSVIVSNRSLWLGDAEPASANSPTKPTSASQRPSPSSVGGTSHRSSMPFSGKAGFELCLLRPTSGRICPPVFLANASTHRVLRQHNRELDLRTTQMLGRIAPESASAGAADAAAERLSVKVPTSVYPALRRSRSRPYLRNPPAQLRRSRSKPYLRASAAQQQTAQPAATGVNPELFAPSLPGDPLLRTHPGESWPSARSRRSDSLSSFDSASASDAASDTSSLDEAALSTTNTRESMTASMSSASYDQVGSKDDERARSRSQAIPMAARGAHPNANRGPRSLSPGSSASRGISSNSETSAAFAGWQLGSLVQQQQQQQQRARKQDNDSISYEAESWLGTSPTTASASSMSASSKQSRGRKGFQKAMQKKDKMLSSWFKRRPENGSTSTSVSSVTDTDKSQPSVAINSGVGMQPSMSTETTNGNTRGSAKMGLTTETTPLTEMALETFQRAMFRPASPESTIMGSRRGSEALTQKTVEPPANDVVVVQRPAQPYAQSAVARSAVDQAADERASGVESRHAVNSTLSQVYGWDQQQAAGKLLRPAANVTELAANSFQDLDEENALLGLDAVPAGALTMLIPLPLIGRNRAQDAVAYMRVNFVPFNSSAASGNESAPGVGNVSMQFGGSPGVDSAASTLPPSVSSGSSQLAERSGAAKSSEQSSWKRKLGLSSSRSGNNAGAYQSQSAAAAAGGANGQAVTEVEVAQKSPQFVSNKFEPFRVTAIVHDAPWTSRSLTEVDPRLPEPSAFPVVLGYCNDSKGLEMVPEGWAWLRLAGRMPTKADGSPLDGMHPSHGVTDLIVAACIAVMDV